MSKTRINVYIRNHTKELLDDYCKANEWDLGTAIDLILEGRLSYLEALKKKAETQLKKDKKTTETETEEVGTTKKLVEIDGQLYLAYNLILKKEQFPEQYQVLKHEYRDIYIQTLKRIQENHPEIEE